MEKKPLNQKKKKKVSLKKKILYGTGIAFLLAVISFFVMFLVVGYQGEKEVSDIHPPASSQIIDMEGKVIATIHATENRTIVDLNQIPVNLQDAFIANEDTRFYDHHGVDIIGIGRAMVKNVVSGGVSEGGSTITQQLAKNAFLSQERTFKRKFKEMVIALQLERRYTKAEILEMYLNQIYFGRGAYGVEAAARTYFGKNVSDLDLAECAMLAGIPRSPNYYSPFNNLEASIKRRNDVLAQMVKYGYITQAQADAASKEVPKLVDNKQEVKQNTASYFIDYVTQEMIEKFGADAVYKEGLKIYVTLDMNMQKEAEETLKKDLPTYYTNENGVQEPQGAIVTIDPKNGYIKAMVGGRGNDEFNRAVLAVRQPGSAFKLFTFITALNEGMSPNSMISNKPFKLGDWTPQNYDRTYSSAESLRSTAVHSLNLPTIRLAEKVGIDKVLDTAEKMGITTLVTDNKGANDKNLAASIGGLTRGVTVLDMAAAYSVLANDGNYIKPVAVIKVEDRRGKVIYENKKEEHSVLKRNVVDTMNSMLQDVVLHGTGRAADIGRPVAGKTGTTDNYQDAWFAGYTPDLVTVVWIGSDDNARMSGVTGGTIPARIWHDYMKAVLKTPSKSFATSPTGSVSITETVGAENEAEDEKEENQDNPDVPVENKVNDSQPIAPVSEQPKGTGTAPAGPIAPPPTMGKGAN